MPALKGLPACWQGPGLEAPLGKPQRSVQRKTVKSPCGVQDGHLKGGTFILSLGEEVLDESWEGASRQW